MTPHRIPTLRGDHNGHSRNGCYTISLLFEEQRISNSGQCRADNRGNPKEPELLQRHPCTKSAGPPEEIDAELGKHLAGYVQTHQQTASGLAEAKATMEAAAKVAQEEAKRKAEERRKSTQKSPVAAPVPSTLAEPPPASESAGTLGLFPAC